MPYWSTASLRPANQCMAQEEAKWNWIASKRMISCGYWMIRSNPFSTVHAPLFTDGLRFRYADSFFVLQGWTSITPSLRSPSTVYSNPS